MSREEEITRILKQHGERLRHLEGLEHGSGLHFVRADKDGDGDYDPLTSTSWDGDAYAAGTGTINWNTVFGVPTTAKAVQVYVSIQDETVGVAFGLRAKSTTTSWAYYNRTVVANQAEGKQGIVPIAANGTSYYEVFDELDAVYMKIVGWYV